MKEQRMLGEEPIGKLLLKYSIPAIIGMLVNALYNIVDRIFIGHIPNVGALAITGVGITMPIMYILLAFGMLVGIGTTANISIKMGQGKREDAEKLLGNCFTLSIIISIILTVIGILFVNKILGVFGASENTLYYAKEYINIILFGAIFNILNFALNSTIRADGSPKMAAFTMILGCLVNIILDAVFIFVFNLGIKGAALATVIAQIISTIWIIYYYTKGNSNLKLKKENFKLDGQLVKIIFTIGVAPFSMQIASSAVQVITNNTLKLYGGDLAIGAMAVILSIAMVFLMPIFGINQGSQPIIGYNYGAKKYHRMKETVKLSIIAATIILIIGSVLIQCFPEAAIKVFNKDDKLLEIGVKGIRTFLIMMPVIGISIIGSNYYQSVGKAKTAMFLSLLRQVILFIPLMIILPRVNGLGLTGIWLTGALSDGLSTLIAGGFLVSEFKSIKENRFKKEF
ncbi:MATE family efflux transporter [Clostridium massiliodielmoense]|uniref:MATE family efflux transporter n=1 Tax=Clostridium massiliodielmoense TaxID=1776385 RepID=UPI000166A64E|nr:MATE family efflux transporter [Clostridium massiliodielmoense]EDS78388.1 mate efflux family protein [Clostridium botulinum C str. Eklund]KEH97989.1 multidrug transporter MatE [Clostridium botulinum C/D str. BKT12695]NEZ49977.1 MATE family efflux transporter [Clostridium botulinum]